MEGQKTKTSVAVTDIEGRYQTPYTAPCDGVVGHGAQFGGLPVFADHTRKGKRKTGIKMAQGLVSPFSISVMAVEIGYRISFLLSQRLTLKLFNFIVISGHNQGRIQEVWGGCAPSMFAPLVILIYLSIFPFFVPLSFSFSFPPFFFSSSLSFFYLFSTPLVMEGYLLFLQISFSLFA